MKVISERSRPAAARSGRAIALVAASALALAACGGDDDSGDETTTTSAPPVTQAPPTEPTAEPTAEPTMEPTATEPEVTPVRDGATVIVANASRVNGAAGRMTDRLRAAGYTTGEATNSTTGQVDTTIVYYDPTNTAAQAVAETLRNDLGGDPVTVEAIPDPPPIEGEMGDATVLVIMGNDTADKSLEELQGVAPETGGDTTGTGETTGGTGETTGDATTTG